MGLAKTMGIISAVLLLGGIILQVIRHKQLESALTGNALSLYPYIRNQTISHGKAAEILGIRKAKLIDIYDRLGYSYLDMTMDGLDLELETFRQLKKRR